MPLLPIEMWQRLVLTRWTSELKALSRRFEPVVVQIILSQFSLDAYSRAFFNKAAILIGTQYAICSMIEITRSIQGGEEMSWL